MNSIIKRVMDLVLGTSVLIITSPILAVAMLVIRVVDGSPVLFKQVRPGYKGRPFTLYKLRTMNARRDATGALAPDAERLTRVGRVLRKFSIDELPQLWNVVIGDMSLVGPRPLLMEYLHHYTAEQRRRHDLLPGITGWAQINGRNELAWKHKFVLDVWYVDHQSLLLDLRILAITFWRVLTRQGISQSGHATAERFDVRSR